MFNMKTRTKADRLATAQLLEERARKRADAGFLVEADRLRQQARKIRQNKR